MQKISFNKGKAQLVLLALLEKRGRVGFIKRKDRAKVPDNFNDLYSEKIEGLFNGKE